MEHLIAQSPIVSTDTLRPDHLCEALLSEADYLGITIKRKLWQIATAIAAHGRHGGICLDLPPKLEEQSSKVVSELLDALNDAAPSGCFLGASEGDGACFMWTLTIEAQCAAINSDPRGRFEAKTFSVPEYWLSALVNADESGLDDRESKQLNAFCKDELLGGWYITSYSEEGDFRKYHDAIGYGVLACNVVDVLAMRAKQ
jgi:hypothetical protein